MREPHQPRKEKPPPFRKSLGRFGTYHREQLSRGHFGDVTDYEDCYVPRPTKFKHDMCNVDPGERWGTERKRGDELVAFQVKDFLRHFGSIKSTRGELGRTVGNAAMDAVG